MVCSSTKPRRIIFERRGEFRAENLGRAWSMADRGELLIGGASADPVDGGRVSDPAAP